MLGGVLYLQPHPEHGRAPLQVPSGGIHICIHRQDKAGWELLPSLALQCGCANNAAAAQFMC